MMLKIRRICGVRKRSLRQMKAHLDAMVKLTLILIPILANLFVLTQNYVYRLVDFLDEYKAQQHQGSYVYEYRNSLKFLPCIVFYVCLQTLALQGLSRHLLKKWLSVLNLAFLCFTTFFYVFYGLELFFAQFSLQSSLEDYCGKEDEELYSIGSLRSTIIGFLIFVQLGKEQNNLEVCRQTLVNDLVSNLPVLGLNILVVGFIQVYLIRHQFFSFSYRDMLAKAQE
mmetsp:Transcript_3232/g.5378  ORF Transcript_3232/g.5378 Transcript_3232/m.5378 type:complete len:226 (+) Transcript_3232:7-684(+)